ncbi:hemolysin family protein [Halogeometricum sp. S1BR25-6]|uniref:Hemolysin family protein n=1 Tax=Halogeometricum salsisoli TaxID=2950536 RepID=A0ABU2GCX6_9EURY|nr:hemolysin family protein [Halogeometricum sp. S1BR25-6]MDS0298652.1 hemolysin family protein [Halogeometricum sp. S1BR25-6]
MQAPEILLRLVAGAALILANGFFVTIEFALTRVRQYPESEFMEAGLERAWKMTEDLEIYLTGCQVGITACSIALGIVAEPALAAMFEPVFGGTGLASIGASVILAYIIVSLVHKIYGEQAPTYLGVERSKQVCRYCATPLYWFTWVIRPILRFGDWVAKWTLSLFGIEMTGAWLESEGEEIEGRTDLHRELGSILDDSEIPEERRQEVMNALAVEEIPIRDSMVPREEIAALSTENTPEENLAVIEEHPYLRFPLVGEDVDDFRGIVYLAAITNQFEAFKNGDIDIEDLAESPMTLPADEEISDAIDRFQTEDQELALVTEEGRVVGLLTSTDAFEEVMGGLEDPIDVYQRERRGNDASGLDSRSDPA